MILNVYTEPEFRRQGVARKVMQAILEWIKARGLHSVNLHASPEGRHLYETLGFEPTNEMRLWLERTVIKAGNRPDGQFCPARSANRDTHG